MSRNSQFSIELVHDYVPVVSHHHSEHCRSRIVEIFKVVQRRRSAVFRNELVVFVEVNRTREKLKAQDNEHDQENKE